MAVKYKKRADGRYLIQVKKGIKANGKPDYENIYATTISELERKAAEFRSLMSRGIIIDDHGLSVRVWAEQWLGVYKTGKELNTYKMYEHAVKKHIIPALGVYKLKDLRQHHVQSLINTLAAKGYTKTIKNVKQTITQMLNKAVEDEYIVKNVAAWVEMPVIKKPKKRSLTEQEKSAITTADFDIKCKAFVYILLYTGIRRGEILALTKDDVDIEQKCLRIDKAVVFDGNKAILKPTPKSDAGNRTIPIPDVLCHVLTEYLSDLMSVYLFPMTSGELITQGSYRRFWEKILDVMCIAAGGEIESIPVEAKGDIKPKRKRIKKIRNVLADDITPHLFRHTYATDIYYAGVDLKAAQYLLGHSSVEVLLEIYTHLDRANDAVTAERINSYHSQIGLSQSKISQN